MINKNIKMKYLKTYNERNEIDGNRYYTSEQDEFEEINGNIIQDEPESEKDEIDGNRYIPITFKKHGDEETGTVRKFFQDRGFGFIIGDNGEDFFTNKYHSIDKIKTGDRVKFTIKRSGSSKNDKAIKVRLL